MFEDILKTNQRLIGMVQPLEPRSEERLHRVGCAGRVTSFTETEDGRYMVTLTGISRFHLDTQQDGFAPYPRYSVNWSGFEHDRGKAERDAGFEREAFLPLLARYFEVAELQTDWDSLKDAEDELLINSLSMLCPFDPEDKQALLEAKSLTQRRKTLMTLMEFALHGGLGEERLQ